MAKEASRSEWEHHLFIRDVTTLVKTFTELQGMSVCRQTQSDKEEVCSLDSGVKDVALGTQLPASEATQS